MNMSNESNESNKTNHHDYPSLNDYEIVLFGVFFPIILPIIVFQLQLKAYVIMLIGIMIGITEATFTIKTNNSKIISIIELLLCVITVYGIIPVNDNIRVLSFIIPLIIGLAGTYTINYGIKNNNANNSIHNVDINSKKNDNTYFTM